MVLRKVELECKNFVYLAEEISKQNVEGQSWLLLTGYNQM